jgi:AcrR family transcriptional regulator
VASSTLCDMKERADAARNRARVLSAAEKLFAERRDVTMEQIAAAAGVGKGTLYRRYPDVASIAQALLDEHEREVQDALLRGPPPLGPGAPAAERLAAFYQAMVDLLERHGHIALAGETGPLRYRTGAYAAWATHVGVLLAETRLEGPALVDALLAPVAPDVFAHQRSRGLSAQEIADALATLARQVMASSPPSTRQ